MSTGAVAAEYSYDSFGALTTTGAEVQRYGFTGREHDSESGLIYFRARHYDPVAGQFIQRDPIGFAAGGLNLYAYVENSPYQWIDPTGLNAQHQSFKALVRNATASALRASGSATIGTLNLVGRIVETLDVVSLLADFNEELKGGDPNEEGGKPNDKKGCKNKNSKSDTSRQKGYMGTKGTGTVDKVGIDAQRGRSDGGFRRWATQFRKWKRLFNYKVQFVQIFEVPDGPGSRAYALAVEKAVAQTLRKVNNETGSEHLMDEGMHKCP